MTTQTRGKLFYCQHEPYIVIEDGKGKVVTRKVLLKNEERGTCKIRMNKEVKEVEYYM